MLREILRKMSRDDSHVRIKSLEQVLQLGQEIVKKETHTHTYTHSPQHNTGYGPLTHGSSPTRQSRLEMLQTAQYADSSPKHPTQATKVIPRRTSAPGAQPEKTARKLKKAFGHPV
ncbi:hypothetical protein EON65_48820 [archaeon]|nr:MAG: hypothetical protein EON65_48820 [archaeon]